jgi:hypothetical protein
MTERTNKTMEMPQILECVDCQRSRGRGRRRERGRGSERDGRRRW